MYLSMHETDPLRHSNPHMEPSGRPREGSDPANIRYQQELSRRQSGQKLPPFRDIIPAHLHDAIESTPHSTSSGHQSPTVASPNFQSMMSTSRSVAPSPVQSQQTLMPSLSVGFDDFAGRFAEPVQPVQNRSRRPSDYMIVSANNPQYSEAPLPCHAQQPSVHQSHHYSSFRSSLSLPSIRTLQPHGERMSSGVEGNYNMPLPSYQNGYGLGLGHVPDTENNPYSSRRPPFYDHSERAYPNYPPTAGNHGLAPSEYHRYEQTTYDPSRGPVAFPGTYVDLDYAPHLMNDLQNANFGVLGDSMDSRGKRRRGNLPKPVTDVLRSWFHEHLDHPYPTEEDKQTFIARTGLSISQISNWFINARRRQLPALRNQVRSQDHERGSHLQTMTEPDRISSQESSQSPR